MNTDLDFCLACDLLDSQRSHCATVYIKFVIHLLCSAIRLHAECSVADVREAVHAGEAADRDEPVAAPQDPAVDVPRRAGRRRLDDDGGGRDGPWRRRRTVGVGQRQQPAIDPTPDGVVASPAERRVWRGGRERSSAEHPHRSADAAAGATHPGWSDVRRVFDDGSRRHGGRQVRDGQPGR